MFTRAEDCTDHPWANLQAKAEGFKTVYARYDSESRSLEIRYPPEGDSQVIEGIFSIVEARRRLASEVSQTSKFVFEQNS